VKRRTAFEDGASNQTIAPLTITSTTGFPIGLPEFREVLLGSQKHRSHAEARSTRRKSFGGNSVSVCSAPPRERPKRGPVVTLDKSPQRGGAVTCCQKSRRAHVSDSSSAPLYRRYARPAKRGRCMLQNGARGRRRVGPAMAIRERSVPVVALRKCHVQRPDPLWLSPRF
jgi:hypothetical protein